MRTAAMAAALLMMMGTAPLAISQPLDRRGDKVTSDGVVADGRATVLSVTVWDIDLQPRSTLDDDQLFALLSERARTRLSAMLYGYRFDYRPENRARQTPAHFALEPVAEIAAEDPRLQAVDRWRVGEQLFGRFVYRATGAETAWWQAWHSSPVPTASGDGAESVWASADEQRQAIINALRYALDTYLRAHYTYKPARVRGTLLLRNGPHVWIDGGEYRARATCFVRLDAVEPLVAF